MSASAALPNRRISETIRFVHGAAIGRFRRLAHNAVERPFTAFSISCFSERT